MVFVFVCCLYYDIVVVVFPIVFNLFKLLLIIIVIVIIIIIMHRKVLYQSLIVVIQWFVCDKVGSFVCSQSTSYSQWKLIQHVTFRLQTRHSVISMLVSRNVLLRPAHRWQRENPKVRKSRRGKRQHWAVTWMNWTVCWQNWAPHSLALLPATNIRPSVWTSTVCRLSSVLLIQFCLLVSDIAIFVLKRDVELQPTKQPVLPSVLLHCLIECIG